MHQFTTPSLSRTIWPRSASKQFLGLPIAQTLLPVTFAYSLSSEAVVMRQLRRWKRLWRRPLTRSHKRTTMDLPEVVRTVQVHCSQRRLLRRVLEFHVYTINKSAHTKKKSGNLSNDPHTFVIDQTYFILKFRYDSCRLFKVKNRTAPVHTEHWLTVYLIDMM